LGNLTYLMILQTSGYWKRFERSVSIPTFFFL
jgi:hypothetical protein